MKSGASCTRLRVSSIFAQSSVETRPPRISASFTSDSAESRRMTISEADISSEKITEDLPCCKEQERIKSMARVDLPTPGRAATMTIWPA